MRAHGIDYSFWATDWKLPLTSRVDFAIQRLGGGLNRDPRYDNHAKRLRQAECKGGYWYYYEWLKLITQVDNFLSAIDDHPCTIHHEWWDVEEQNNDFSNRERIANETAQAIERLREHRDDPGLYCNLDIYNNYLRPYLGDEWLNDVPLWLAWPIHDYPLEYFRDEANQPNLPRGRETWTFWQVKFNGDPDYYGIVDKKAVDVNVYNGTLEQMREAYGTRPKLSAEEILRRARRMLARIR